MSVKVLLKNTGANEASGTKRPVSAQNLVQSLTTNALGNITSAVEHECDATDNDLTLHTCVHVCLLL